MEATPEDPLPHLIVAMSGEPSLFIVVGPIIIALLFLSGLISGSEVAFFSFTHNQIRDFNASDDLNEKRISRLLHHPKRLLATILILNNLVNIFIITIATYAAWQIMGDRGEAGVVIASLTTIITALIIFFGEIIPKVYANHNSISFAIVTSRLLMFSYKFLKPVSWFLMSVTKLVEQRVEKKGYNLSVEEINQALEISVEKEEVTEKEKGMLKGIVNFGTLSVKQIMKSRMDITAYDKETDFHELMNQINKNGYSRIPIFSETVDKIEGILYIKDLLPHLDEGEDFRWQELLRPALFVPESKKIDDLFKDFQKKQVHIAVVINEYGGTSGLVTMEDVIEEIVGEINDEFDDDQEVAYNKLDNNTYIFEGKTSLNDFCKITHSDITTFDQVKGESESLGGLILELNSKLPGVGEKISYQRFVFTVVAVDLRRIKRLRVHITPEKSHTGKFED